MDEDKKLRITLKSSAPDRGVDKESQPSSHSSPSITA
jgi:hypothetical protein